MGTSYIYVCDERKQYIDPYPLDCPHLFVWLQCHLTESIAGDYIYGWSGCEIRFINDSGDQDEYYLRTSRDLSEAEAFGGTMADVYTDVTKEAIATAKRWYPEAWWERK